jgi:hypothetical protein
MTTIASLRVRPRADGEGSERHQPTQHEEHAEREGTFTRLGVSALVGGAVRARRS